MSSSSSSSLTSLETPPCPPDTSLNPALTDQNGRFKRLHPENSPSLTTSSPKRLRTPSDDDPQNGGALLQQMQVLFQQMQEMSKQMENLQNQLSRSVTCEEKTGITGPFCSSWNFSLVWQRLMKGETQIEPDKLVAHRHVYYSGQTQNYLPHGLGTWYYAGIGAYYQGVWRNGYKCGGGILSFPTGTLLEGEWIPTPGASHTIAYVYGVLITPKEKTGPLMWAFLDPDCPVCSDSCSDYGEGLDITGISKVEGFHTITFDGDTYEGEWLNGMKHGKGVEKDGKGKILRKGTWLDDQFQNDSRIACVGGPKTNS